MPLTFVKADKLEEHLKSRSYISGYSLSEDDVTNFKALASMPNPSSAPNTYRWALHVAALTGSFIGAPSSSTSSSCGSSCKCAPGTCKCTPGNCMCGDGKTGASSKKDADMDDLFGDDDEEDADEAAATKARRQRMEQARKLKEEADAKANAGKEKKEKVKAVEKSLVVLEVKPWEADTDLKMVWEKIREYQQEGLSWGETFKLEPVAYGIMKLVMTCTIVDSLVLMDDITENIEALEEYVQSVNVASMNKIS